MMNTLPENLHCPSEVAAILPDLIDRIVHAFGESVDQIILHGSATNKNLFRPGSSDLDLVILYSGAANLYIGSAYAELHEYANSLTGPWTKIEISLHRREKMERLRNFELCYEGRVCRGCILYDAARSHTHLVLPRSLAQSEVVEQYMYRTWRWLSQNQPSDNLAPWSACRAACSAFQAMLVKHDIDISPKSFRWNLPALFAAAIQYHPELAKLSRHVAKMPVDLAGMELIQFDSIDRETDEAASIKLMAAAIWIALACGKIAGYKPSYRSMRKLLDKLRFEQSEPS